MTTGMLPLCEMVRAPLLTRYEIARLVGMRSLQLSTGEVMPSVAIDNEILRSDTMYVAAREIYERAVDMKVGRGGGTEIHIRDARFPNTLSIMLDTKDGGNRGSS